MGKKADYNETPIAFEPEFRGPRGKRSCTDIVFLVLFLGFLVGWAGVGIYAVSYGNIDVMLKSRDALGRRCGVDSGVKDKPYLMFFDLEKCAQSGAKKNPCKTQQVCVEKCPVDNFHHERHVMSRDIDMSSLRQRMICRPEVDKTAEIRSYETAQRLMAERKCVSRYTRSKPSSLNICVPLAMTGLSKEVDGITPESMAAAFRAAKRDINLEDMGTMLVDDLYESWWKIVIALVLAMVVCLLYIFLMRWFAGPMVWISLIGVVLLLAAGVAVSFIFYVKSDEDSNEALSFLILGIFLAILLAVLLLLILCSRKQIAVSIALIKVGSRAVSSVKSSLVFPLFPWIMQAAVIGYTVFITMEILSIDGAVQSMVPNVPNVPNLPISRSSADLNNQNGPPMLRWQCTGPLAKYTDKELIPYDHETFEQHCTPVNGTADDFDPYEMNLRRRLRSEDGVEDESSGAGYFIAYNIFGFFWAAIFVVALGDMILATAFATWYWTLKKSDVPYFTLIKATYRVHRYHIGTLAFGSLILAIVRVIRFLLNRNKNSGNKACNRITCLCRCCCFCLDRFIKFINKNAYIMCAIHGTNFCTSAKNAFSLIMRNVGQFVIADKVTDLLIFVSKLLVTLLMGALSYLYFANDWADLNEDNLIYGAAPPVIIIVVGTFIIATVFFGVYDMAIDTISLCFLEDCERNDGSPARPYFMSGELMKIMHKENVHYNK